MSETVRVGILGGGNVGGPLVELIREQAGEIAAAKNLNKAISKRTGKKRRGTVFPDRYHAVVIRSPRQARNNLAYVLNNWRRHGENKVRSASSWSATARRRSARPPSVTAWCRRCSGAACSFSAPAAMPSVSPHRSC